jgi:hypothetical protein
MAMIAIRECDIDVTSCGVRARPPGRVPPPSARGVKNVCASPSFLTVP